MFVMGMDIGAYRVSVIVADKEGRVYAKAVCEYPPVSVVSGAGRNEQNPQTWWDTALTAVRECVDTIKQSGYHAEDIICVAADGTSGTVFLGDENGGPLTPAIVYDDKRALAEAELLNSIGRDYEQRLGIRFNELYGLPKLLWLKKNMPVEYDSAAHVMHPSDYILAKLTGKAGVSDYSTALKTGYDIIDGGFDACVYDIGIAEEKLPEILAPGEVAGNICKSAAEATGLSEKTMVAAGATDGYASGLSSGTVEPGRWASILGATFVVKGVTKDILRDKEGRIYCHKHPDGYYMPSGMSNAGGKCLEDVFGKENLKKFDASVLGLIPTNILIYPLTGTGERFPFIKKDAQKFVIGHGGEREIYTAHLEGLSFVEKLAFETMEKLGCCIGNDIYAVGGSTKGLAWLKIRATVLNRELHIPKETTPAMGSAMLAASHTLYGDLTSASLGMFCEERVVTPYYDFVSRYERLYLEFKDKCSAVFSVDL